MGIRYGGRKPLTPAGPAVQTAIRFPRELVADLAEMAEATGATIAAIVRRGAENEVKKWRKRAARAAAEGKPGP